MLSRSKTSPGDAAKLGRLRGVAAVELVHAQAELAAEAAAASSAQHRFQMRGVLVPDAVAHDLVEAKPQFGGAAAQAYAQIRDRETARRR